MTNLDIIIDLRRGGVKPKAVWIDIVATLDHGLWPMDPLGIVYSEIVGGARLSDIDFRPLHGLRCHVVDHTGDLEFHRRVVSLIAEVDPCLIVMPIAQADGGFLIRKHFGGPSPRITEYSI